MLRRSKYLSFVDNTSEFAITTYLGGPNYNGDIRTRDEYTGHSKSVWKKDDMICAKVRALAQPCHNLHVKGASPSSALSQLTCQRCEP